MLLNTLLFEAANSNDQQKETLHNVKPWSMGPTSLLPENNVLLFFLLGILVCLGIYVNYMA